MKIVLKEQIKTSKFLGKTDDSFDFKATKYVTFDFQQLS